MLNMQSMTTNLVGSAVKAFAEGSRLAQKAESKIRSGFYGVGTEKLTSREKRQIISEANRLVADSISKPELKDPSLELNEKGLAERIKQVKQGNGPVNDVEIFISDIASQNKYGTSLSGGLANLIKLGVNNIKDLDADKFASFAVAAIDANENYELAVVESFEEGDGRMNWEVSDPSYEAIAKSTYPELLSFAQ